ncbi:MAG: hypothetical protein KGI46_07940 [Alphaproteobacteria bacterium]|nr:hypothetical protein [Alphaproteobacteria bacterium]MDE1932326.1 hypothetical protein [Alphaproteobacteria bacterium]
MPDTTHPNMHSEVENLRAEIRQLQNDLAGLADSVRGVVRAGKAEAVGRVSDTADKAWSEAKGMAESLSQQIEEKPLTALVSAFSIGMLLGLLFTGRRT